MHDNPNARRFQRTDRVVSRIALLAGITIAVILLVTAVAHARTAPPWRDADPIIYFTAYDAGYHIDLRQGESCFEVYTDGRFAYVQDVNNNLPFCASGHWHHDGATGRIVDRVGRTYQLLVTIEGTTSVSELRRVGVPVAVYRNLTHLAVS